MTVLGLPIDTVMRHLTECLTYLQRNAWSIVFIIVCGYFVKSKVIDPFIANQRRKESIRTATDPHRVSTLEEDMRRVRAAQQEELARAAKQAAEERRKKELEERERKRIQTPMEKKSPGGRRLNEDDDEAKKKKKKKKSSTSGSGGGSIAGGGYNPMSPWSGSTSGYRAPRRNPRRG